MRKIFEIDVFFYLYSRIYISHILEYRLLYELKVI